MPLEPALAQLAEGGVFIGLSFFLGAAFGSFANVCIFRLPPSEAHPDGLSIVSPGSRCMGCGADIRWYDNLPIVSYLWLRGRCRGCGIKYGAQYVLVEVLTGLLFLAMYYQAVLSPYAYGDTLLRWHRFGILAAFAFTLVVITFIDLEHKLILNKITYPAIPLFYLAGISLPEGSWKTGLIGIAVGYGVVRLISDGYYYLTGREGLGYGDGKLLAIVGALYGWHGVVFTLFVGSLLGSVISISLLSWRRARSKTATGEALPGSADEDSLPAAADDQAPQPLRQVEVPFGPFLAAGALCHAFAYPWLVRYLAFMSL